MIIVGDADGVTLEQAVGLFKLRGGDDGEAVTKGNLSGPPRARLAIFHGLAHRHDG